MSRAFPLETEHLKEKTKILNLPAWKFFDFSEWKRTQVDDCYWTKNLKNICY